MLQERQMDAYLQLTVAGSEKNQKSVRCIPVNKTSPFSLDQKFLTRCFSQSRLFYEFLHVGYRILHSPSLLSRKATSAALDTFSFTFVNGQEQILESRDEQVQHKKTDNIEEQKRCS
jgi:hypothetical protein